MKRCPIQGQHIFSVDCEHEFLYFLGGRGRNVINFLQFVCLKKSSFFFYNFHQIPFVAVFCPDVILNLRKNSVSRLVGVFCLTSMRPVTPHHQS